MTSSDLQSNVNQTHYLLEITPHAKNCDSNLVKFKKLRHGFSG